MSHQNFGAFFSGTDLGTLLEEGKDTNHFVSLIVNNAGSYCAAITKKVKEITKGERSFKYNTFNDNVVEGSTASFESETFYIEYYPLEITVEEAVKSELELRLEEVRNSSKSYVNKGRVTLDAEIKEAKEVNINKYYQPSLFSPQEMGEKPKKDNGEEYTELDMSIGYGEEHIDSVIVKNTVMQIITGDIFSIYKQNIDLNKWAANMEVLYDKRFKVSDELGNNSSSYWIDGILEFLENEVIDDKFADKDRDYMDAIWAFDVISELEKFPSNKYLKAFIDSLERWLI